MRLINSLSLLVAGLFYAGASYASDIVFKSNFKENINGWFPYNKDTSELFHMQGEAFSGNASLKVKTSGIAQWEGAGAKVEVEPQRAYWITVQVKGEGIIVLCANGTGGWCYGLPEKLSMDSWKELKIRRYEKGNSVSFFINAYSDSRTPEKQKAVYYVDDVSVEKEKQIFYPEKEFPFTHYNAVDYHGTGTVVKDESNVYYVEGTAIYNNYLASNVPFPETAMPLYIYLLCWLDGSKDVHLSIMHSSKQRASEMELPEHGKWTWLKTGPFYRNEIGNEFSVCTIGGKLIKGKLASIVISSNDGLDEKTFSEKIPCPKK